MNLNETTQISISYIHHTTSNLTNNFQPSRLSTALGATIAFAFMLIGLLGDLLITFSILHKKELRNNLVNIFIVSLQINDIFNIGFNQLFVGLAYANMEWKGPLILCEIVVYTSIIITSVQLWHHALIAIHRYLVVVCNQTIYYMGMSPKIYVLSSLIIARLIPTLVCSPAFVKKMTEYSPSALRCMLAPKISGFQNLLIVIINMLIPCIIVTFCFLRIFTRVHNVSKNIRSGLSKVSLNTTDPQLQKSYNQLTLLTPNSKKCSTTTLNDNKESTSNTNYSNNNNHCCSSLTASMAREIQITKMFSILFTVFLFGYLPYGIIRLIDKSNSLHPDFYILLTVLFITSISVSPIIYGLMNTQIRTQCIFILNLIFHKKITKKQNFLDTSTTFTARIKDKYIISRLNDVDVSQVLNESPKQSKVQFDLVSSNIKIDCVSVDGQDGEELDGGKKRFCLHNREKNFTP
jgi:hypothetical protein